MTTRDLADRLTRLERENRRLKRIGAVVLIGIVAVVVMGQAKRPEVHDVLAAKQFILKDGDGKDRARLRMLGETVEFAMLDGESSEAIRLTADHDGGAWLLLGGRISLACDDKFAQMYVADERGPNGLIAFTAVDHGCARLGLRREKDRRPQAVMEIWRSRSSPNRIIVRDKKGETAFEGGEKLPEPPK